MHDLYAHAKSTSPQNDVLKIMATNEADIAGVKML